MRREPVSAEPRTSPPRRDDPSGAGRPRRAWAYVAGALVLVGTFAIAWNLLHTPGRANGPVTASPASMERRAVAIAYVDVAGGVRNLYPTRQGLVKSVPVAEGVEVAEGTVLLQVDDAIARVQEKEAGLAVKAAEAKLAEARGAVELQDGMIRSQQAAVQAAAADVEAAEAQASKARRYVKQEIRGGEEDVKAAEALVSKARAALAGEKGKLASLIDAKSKRLAHLIEQAQIDVEAKKEQLKKAEEDRKAHQLLAPTRGKVLRRMADVGEALGANPRAPALVFCPSGERIVRAEVEQEFAGRVAVNQRAVIEDDATGGGEWRGKVTQVSDWYSQRRSILLEPLQFNDVRTLEVIIRLDDQKAPLRIGQRVRVMLEGAN